MRLLLLLGLLCCAPPGLAAVINVEFKFSPFEGDPATSDHVSAVPGTARLYMNNVPLAEQPVQEQELMVLFQEREVTPSVWLPTQSLGGVLRKGKNLLRIEFEPADTARPYTAQLSWSYVTDQASTQSTAGGTVSTNIGDSGKETRTITGKAVFEREFTADFATDQPWHHYPPTTALDDGDRAALAALVKQRADAFSPDFSAAYDLAKAEPRIDLAGARKLRCLEEAYAAGVRIVTAADLDFVLTGNAEVVIRSKQGRLYGPGDPSSFGRIKSEDVQMCAGMLLAFTLPDHLVAVRTPAGTWEVVH